MAVKVRQDQDSDLNLQKQGFSLKGRVGFQLSRDTMYIARYFRVFNGTTLISSTGF